MKPKLIFEEAVYVRMQSELEFVTKQFGVEMVLTIYWQSGVFKDNEQIVKAGYLVQALPKEEYKGQLFFFVNGLPFSCDTNVVGEINNKQILVDNDRLVLQ